MRKIEIPYTPETKAAYKAWLEEGNQGTFDDFVQEQGKITYKKILMEKITEELNDMNLKKLRLLLDFFKNGLIDKIFEIWEKKSKGR